MTEQKPTHNDAHEASRTPEARPAPTAPSINDAPWQRFYDVGVPTSLDYRNVPLYTWLDEVADQEPDVSACRFYNTNLRYGELRRQAEVMAANLRDAGVKKGDRVGLMLPNLPQTIIAFWGVLKAGAVVTMINPLYMEKELVHQIRDADLRHLITLDLCWPKLEKLRGRLGVERYYITTIAKGLSFPLNMLHRLKSWREKNSPAVPYDGTEVLPFESLLKGRRRLSEPVNDPKSELALLQYTGGTTGLSKGAMLTHFNMGANIQQINAVLRCLHGKRQVIMAVAPFFHVYGLNTCLVLPTLLRATVVPIPRFSPTELLTGIDKHKVTVLPAAPAVYLSLLHQKNRARYSLESLKICICGSSPMPAEGMRQFEQAFGARITEGYGLSEASPITHLNPTDGLRRVGAIGLPFPDTEARIVDMELGTVPVPPGRVGELIVRGPQVMSGYWNKPDETAGTLRNGWLYTGDIATMDEDGYFFIQDRKKDMIIVGGYNVSPREIDEVLFEHPKVHEAVSVGIPHPTRGEVIKAYVVLKEGETAERNEIISWCRERLAGYKVPRLVEFRRELPKTLVGKVLRRALREEEEKKLAELNRPAAECAAAKPDAPGTGAVESSPAEENAGQAASSDK